MIDNKKEEYGYVINNYTKNIIEGLIPKRIVPFKYYEERAVDEEVKNWLERCEGEFAVIIGDAGFGKTSLLCNLANELLNEEHYTVFFVKSENLRDKDFDKKILDDFEITETGLNAFLRRIIEENKKVIFLLDTLDVIATYEGIARLDDFLTKVKGEKRVIIGASRPLEFKKIEELTKKTFTLKPFSDDEIRHLFDKYKAFYKMEGVELGLPVLEVCRNPLHMRMLFEVYQPDEIPEDINTQKLYDRYWNKKVAEIRIGALSHLDEGKKRKAEEVKEDIAKNIASEMFASKQITLSKSDIKKIKGEMREDYSKIQSAAVRDSTDVTITQIIKEPAIEHDTIIDDAYHDLLDEGVLREQEDSVEFFHQSFFEYAAARAIIEKEDNKQLGYLLKNITLLENRAVIKQVILYAKRKKKNEIAHEFLKKLLKTNLHTKMLAIDLLKHIETLTEEDLKIYQNLTEDKIGIRIYFVESLDLIISVHPTLAHRLIVNLSYDEHVVVRKAVAKALPMLFDVDRDLAGRLIMNLMDDEDVEVQLEVLDSQIGDRFDEEAVDVGENVKDVFPEIDNLSNDLDSIVRRDVAMELSEIKSLSNDEDGGVLEAIAGQLPKIGNLSNDLDSIMRKNDVEVLSEIENLSNDEDMDIREAVAESLLKLLEVNSDLASRLIEKLSNDEDMDVRSIVAKAQKKLLEVNPDLASRLIGKLCNDKHSSVRGDVAKALPELLEVNPNLASSLIEKLSNDKNVDVRSIVVVALLKLLGIKPDLASRLIDKLSNDKNVDVRREVAKTLSEIKNLSNYEYLVPRRRRDVIEAFAEFLEVNPDFASSLFKNLSNDKDWFVRSAVADALPKLLEVNPDLASRLIENLHNDEHGAVRNSVANALPEFLEINPELASRLIENLRNDEAVDVKRLARALPKLLEVNSELASRLIEKLGNLVPFIEDEAVEVREAVEKALLKFAELSPNKACALIEKLKDTEGISIQKAIKKIIEKRHLDRFQHDEKISLKRRKEDEETGN